MCDLSCVSLTSAAAGGGGAGGAAGSVDSTYTDRRRDSSGSFFLFTESASTAETHKHAGKQRERVRSVTALSRALDLP